MDNLELLLQIPERLVIGFRIRIRFFFSTHLRNVCGDGSLVVQMLKRNACNTQHDAIFHRFDQRLKGTSFAADHLRNSCTYPTRITDDASDRGSIQVHWLLPPGTTSRTEWGKVATALGTRDPRDEGSRLIGVSVDHGAGHQRILAFRVRLRGNLAPRSTGPSPPAWMLLIDQTTRPMREFILRAAGRVNHTFRFLMSEIGWAYCVCTQIGLAQASSPSDWIALT